MWQEAVDKAFPERPPILRCDALVLRPAPTWDRLVDGALTGPIAGIHELCLHDLDNDNPALGHAALADIDLPYLQERGGHVLGTFMTWFGGRMNQAVTLVAWPDAKSWHTAQTALLSDPEVMRRHDAARRARGCPLLRGTEAHLLRPLRDWAPEANLGRA